MTEPSPIYVIHLMPKAAPLDAYLGMDGAVPHRRQARKANTFADLILFAEILGWQREDYEIERVKEGEGRVGVGNGHLNGAHKLDVTTVNDDQPVSRIIREPSPPGA